MERHDDHVDDVDRLSYKAVTAALLGILARGAKRRPCLLDSLEKFLGFVWVCLDLFGFVWVCRGFCLGLFGFV